MGKKPATRKPPYGSFKTTRTFIDKLQKTVVPDYIDRSMMTSMSGDAKTETLSGFRFLGLVGEQDSSQDSLNELVNAFGTDTWSVTLGNIITRAYGHIIGDLNISKATEKMLSERFRAAGVDGFMQARCIRFYLAALKEAGMPVSPLLKAPAVKKSKPSNRKTKKRGGNGSSADAGTNGGDSETSLPEGYEEMPLPPGRKFIFPADISDSDVTMITAVLSAYAARREESEP